MKYNKLTDLGFSHKDKYGKPHHLFLCECGNKSTRDYYQVKRGATKSCGCSKKGNATHNLSKTRLYSIWNNMKSRCRNSKHPAYHHYGGRGIDFSKKWEKFDNFYNDMFPTYKPGLTLDRIDNNGRYSKKNCRWATIKEQSENRRTNVLYTWNGKTKTLNGWSQELNILRRVLQARVHAYGWPLDKAFTQKVKQKTLSKH